MKNLAIKIASGVLVVALVVVVALAISGVFSGNTSNNEIVASADPTVENTQVLNGVAANKVFYITSTQAIKDLSSYVIVKDPDGKKVNLSVADAKDENGNIGFLPSTGSWVPGLAYKIQLISSSVAFADEKYAGKNELIFVVEAEDVIECEMSENVVFLDKDNFQVLVENDDSWILTINNVDEKYSNNTVFVYQAAIGEQGKRFENVDQYFTSVAYKIDRNVEPTYNAGSRTMIATVVNAEADDVYSKLNVHQSGIEISESTFTLNEAATLQSVYQSDWFLSTVAFLYGEELGNKTFKIGDYGTFSIDYDFHKEKPVYATVDMNLTFKGFLKSAKNAEVTIKISNKLTPTAKLNFQKDPKAFDVGINADLVTNVSVNGGFEYNFDNKDDENNTEANTALKNIVSKVCNIVSDAINSKNETEKSYIFATWVIPVGTTPIQIVENMGIEVKSDVKAKLSASASNVVTCEFGVAYVDSKITPYFNIDDKFNFGGLTLTGTWENKVGICNEIGITACGIISINLDVSFGVYLDLAGRLEMEGWSIMNEELNIVPAYYVELGLYTTMKVNGKVWTFTIAQQTFLNKKWPLWNTGYKYVPQNRGNEEDFKDETVYLNSSYFYVTKFDTYAIDIQHPEADGKIYSINWDEFNYEYDSSLLVMKDNKVRVAATAPAEFETSIKVTSKVNKTVSKQIKVVKAADSPTADLMEMDYVKYSGAELYYVVHLNTSKFIGMKVDNVALTQGQDYDYADEILTVYPGALNKLAYGSHTLLFESSKGYLRLTANVVSDKDIVPANGFGPYTFDKAIPTALAINMPLYGNTIAEVSGLNADEWSYSTVTDTFKVNVAALMNTDGRVFSVNYSNGENATISVVCADNRQPVLKTTSYDYNLNSGASLPLDVELYGKEITSAYLGSRNVTAQLNGKEISVEAFANVPTGTVKGKFFVGSTQYDFTVNVGANNMLIVNAKSAVFDKADAKDVKFDADIPDGKVLSATISGTKCGSFSQGKDVLTISKEYFANLDSGDYTFVVVGAENTVELKVTVVNSTAPSMKDATVVSVNKADTSSKVFKWNLQETSENDIYVVGIEQDAYTIERQGLTLNVDVLPYGVNTFTVYTAVNSFDFQVNVTGDMKWAQKSYNFQLTENKEMMFYVDMADKTFQEVKILSGDKEVELYNTQLRYNNGVVTISNDYAYNLAAGTYNLELYATDGSSVGGAVLNVQGKLPTFSSVTSSTGTKGSPFMIYTKEQFVSIAKTVNGILSKYVTHKDFEGVYFELGADIDMDYAEVDPIGSEKVPFKGSFNGNGYTIQNLKIKDVNDGYTGLFAYNEGTIQNLRLVNISVDVAKHGSVGIGLVVGNNSGTIKNVSVVGGVVKAVSKSWQDVLNAYFDIGGVVGYNSGTISRVDAEVEITAEVKGLKVAGITIGGRKSYINVGAIVGYFHAGKVQRCSVSASIDAKSHNDSVTSNGWYGNSDLSEEEIAEDMKRCTVYVK